MIIMRERCFLYEVVIQGTSIQGMFICKTKDLQSAEKLLRATIFRSLQNMGTWKSKDDEGTPLGVCRDDVNIIKELNIEEHKFPYYPVEELRQWIIPPPEKKKRKTSNEVVLNKRKKHQKQLEKKEENIDLKKKIATNAAEKAEIMQQVHDYFLGEPKQVKAAVKDLKLQYQKIRYNLHLIRDKGYNGVEYDLQASEIDGNKAFCLVKKEK